MRLVYVIGVPGAGKSTLCAGIEAQWEKLMDGTKPFAYRGYWDPQEDPWPQFISLGEEREVFSGTDTLSMSVAPKAVEWLPGCPYPLVLGEGDRLGTASFFEAMRKAGVDLQVVLLKVTPERAAERRAERGTGQNEQWLKGRETKVANLAPYVTTVIDASLPPSAVLATFLSMFPEFDR